MVSEHDRHPEIVRRNARWGLVLFTIYLALFGGFLYLNVFHPDAMGKTEIDWSETREPISLGGVNVAVVYGMMLIFAAILLALYYMRITWAIARSLEARGGPRQ